MMASTHDQKSVGIPGIGMTSVQEADAIVQGPALLVTLETIEIMANTIETNGTIETTETTGSTEKGSTEKETTVTTGKVVATTAIAMTGTAMTESVMTEIVMTENVMTETAEEAILAIAILAEARVRKALVQDDATCDRRTVFVMQLSARLKTSELEEFFAKAGRVRAARIIEDRNTGRSKGVGYVEFYEEESVAKAIALTGQKLLDIPVIAKHTESEKNRLALQAASQAAQDAATAAAAQPASTDLSQHRLYVGSVNFDLTEDDLKQVLEPFGPIEFIKLHRDAETGKSKGFAFVQYKSAEDAKQAMERLNGYVLAGRSIKVGLVTERGTNPQNTSSYHNNGQINNSISIDDSDTAGYAMTSQSRAELMQKLARGDASLGAVPPVAATPTPAVSAPSFMQLPVVMPSRAVLLKNMFTDEDKSETEWAKELEEDVKEEAEKSGPVVHIHIEQDSPGEIYLKFDTVQSATNAVQALGGRFFAGRQIVAAYLPEMLYNVRFPRAANL
ncbi:hypothetical protein BGX34_007333 [Mortierella sp. NVP85]|nr:hypothetical protein BGX34_007333 [Mortierella sp. NVP85]